MREILVLLWRIQQLAIETSIPSSPLNVPVLTKPDFCVYRSPGFTPQVGHRRDSAALRIALLIEGLYVVMLNDESRLGRYPEFLPLRKEGTLQPRCCLL